MLVFADNGNKIWRLDCIENSNQEMTDFFYQQDLKCQKLNINMHVKSKPTDDISEKGIK